MQVFTKKGHMGKGERRKEKSASKREQRKFIYSAEPTQERTQNQVYLNYVERQGGRQDVNSEQSQDRKAGLKEKSTPSASLVPPVSGGQSERKGESMKGEMKSGKETCEV